MIQTPTKKVAPQHNAYWEKFDQLQKAFAASSPAWLSGLRKTAISRFAEIGFPTLKDEDWRFTNVAPIAKLPFQPGLERTTPRPDAAAIEALTFNALPGPKLVFVDGHYAPELSSHVDPADGLMIGSVRTILENNPELLEGYLSRNVEDRNNPFVALNTAFFTDGLFIRVPARLEYSSPVQFIHISTVPEAGAASHLRHVLVAEKGSALTFVESYISLSSSAGVTNTATELIIGEGARFEHCKFQDENPSHFHLASFHATIQEKANLTAHSFVLGARIARNNIRTALEGEGVECILNGLYLTRGDQLADHHMIVDHAKAHCNSHEYFNGILEGRSRGVFHGRILVRPGAQKTDAKQTNKNLLLSDDASIDTKPQLEIYADDVKCTHGATIGQLNDESIFYLRARGIGEENARRMLIHAFAGEIIDRIRYAPVREALDRLIWERLEQNKQIAVKT